MKYLFMICFLFSVSTVSLGRELTESYSCDTCDYQDAVALAKTLYNTPDCKAINTSGGMAEFGGTTYSCDANPKTLIISNPTTQSSFKFLVSTDQYTNQSTSYAVTIADSTMSDEELSALQEFYDIDSVFRQAIEDLSNTPITSSMPNQGRSFLTSKGFTTNDTSDEPNCDAHPSNILSEDPAFFNTVEAGMKADITENIGDESWNKFTGNTNTSTTLQISRGGFGVSFSSMSHNTKGTYITRQYGSEDNKLVFAVSYFGESKGDRIEGWFFGFYPIAYERNLNLKFTLIPSVSKLDGQNLGNFTSNNAVTFGDHSGLSECLLKVLEEGTTELTETMRTNFGQGVDIGSVNGVLDPFSGYVGNACRVQTRKFKACIANSNNCTSTEVSIIKC